jgi:uncharacterized protein YcbX
MTMEIGHIEAIFRYPVKSMRGEPLEVCQLGWHGLKGDRRLAFRRMEDRSGFPWLTAGKLPGMLLFAPHRCKDAAQDDFLPTFARRMANCCLSSARTWQRRSHAATGLPYR